MAAIQRIFAMLMAAAMVFVFLVPLAMRAHNYVVVALVIAVFSSWLAVNAWLFVRMRKRS